MVKVGNETLPITSTRSGMAPKPQLALMLVVYHRAGAEVMPLTRERPLVVGRDRPADIVLDDDSRSLSREHARFTFDGEAVTVEDLGSMNGTRVAGERITEPTSISVGTVVELGHVHCVVHTRGGASPSLPELESHDDFLKLLRQHIGEARHFQEPTTIMMFEVRDKEGSATHVSRWYGEVLSAFRQVDVLALYSSGTLEALLPREAEMGAVKCAQKIIGALVGGGLWVGCGIASFPSAGTGHEALVNECRHALSRAKQHQPIVVAAGTSRYEVASGPTTAMIANSPAMRSLLGQLERVARAKLPVLLLGETGTGKEVLARAIHDHSPRSGGPLVATNCGAIPSQLVESTLFGHVRGAFTGADRSSKGVLGSAHGGTVLLDEVGELPAAAQAALLRVLETGRVARVGSADEVAVDVRVIAATHRDLEAMVAEGTFREDLLYRINALTLSIPPLRDRVEDIEPLARTFLANASAAVGDTRVTAIGDEAMRALCRHRWPGNIRELRNVIERACVIAEGSTIEPGDLPERARAGRGPAVVTEGPDDGTHDLRETVRVYEIQLIERALAAADGNTALAAERLNLPRRTLTHKMKALDISRDDG